MALSIDLFGESYSAAWRTASAGAAVLRQRHRWLYCALALAVCVWWSCMPEDNTTYINSHDSLGMLGAFAVYYISIMLFIISFIDQTETAKV